MAAVQDSMHCGCRFLFWCILAQILRRTRFRSAVAVESNEACKCAQCITGSQKSGRHKLPLSVEVRTKSGLPFQVKSSDVSSSGCYLEMMTPLQMGTVVELSFNIGVERVCTEATVRTSDLGVGMGLEFTSIDGDSQRRLQNCIHEVVVE